MLFLLAIVSLSLEDLRVPPQLGEPALEPIPAALEAADRDEYLLGAGDLVMVVVEGGSSQAQLASGLAPQSICDVSSDGMLSVSGIGQIQVRGLSINEAERQLQSLASRFFPRCVVRLSLLQPRLIRVRASGMVGVPGTYAMYSLQRVSDLLSVCGGLAFPASRSGWMFAGGDSTRIDLLIDTETHSPVSDPMLMEDAVVVFEACTNPVFVVSPTDSTIQAWDIPEPVPLSGFLETIGGAGGPVDLTRSVLRHGGVGVPLWTADGIADTHVVAGDTLLLAAIRDSVVVGGAVEVPSMVAWSPGLTTMDYIVLAGGLAQEASSGGITVTRDGREIARGGDAESLRVMPGDVIRVPYTWIARNYQLITLTSAVVSLLAIMKSL
jgi:protein involved in polysaccharide export with SLBB domain